MGRVMGFIALCIVVGVATGLVLDRVIVGMLVGAGLFLVGLFILISRADAARGGDREGHWSGNK